jgi:hypothetical protein
MASNLPWGGDLAHQGRKGGKMERSLLIPLAMRDLRTISRAVFAVNKANRPVF